eukprot:TRINITY_DN8950_c0_g1_i1.p1 TRINITY_DN8950_c0_g1~~TRINITY_DN8950_c0_g1_i1.p1  ORF type:complete len:325 (-),score=54.39 TRINITY_DN8950_c0_g1_i1:56-1030(-)
MQEDGGADKKAGYANPPSTNVWIGDLPMEINQEQFIQIFQQYGIIKSAILCPPKQGKKASGMIRFERQEEATFVVDTLHGNIPMGLTDPIVCNYANDRKKGKGDAKGTGGMPMGQAAWDYIAGIVESMGGAPQMANAQRSHPYSSGGAGNKSVFSAGIGGGKGRAQDIYMGIKNLGILGAGKPPPECEVYVGNIPADATNLFLYQLMSPFGAIAHTGVRVMTHPDGSCKGFGFVDFVDPTSAAGAVTALDGLQLPNGKSLIVSRKSDYNYTRNLHRSGAPIGDFGESGPPIGDFGESAQATAMQAQMHHAGGPDFNAIASMLLS